MDLTAWDGALKIPVELPPSKGGALFFCASFGPKPATGGMEQGS